MVEKTVLDNLRTVADQFGHTVPNVYRTLARSPLALRSFMELEGILAQPGRLTRKEKAVVTLQVALNNECRYCSNVFHLEAREAGVSKANLQALLAGTPAPGPRYRTLSEATRRIMERRGGLGQAEQTLWARRGLDTEALLEIISIISAFTLATYANNLAGTRIDPEYRQPSE